jgi:hypothetical protein
MLRIVRMPSVIGSGSERLISRVVMLLLYLGIYRVGIRLRGATECGQDATDVKGRHPKRGDKVKIPHLPELAIALTLVAVLGWWAVKCGGGM